MSEVKITKTNFESEVLKSDKPVLLDFWATWCGPCQMLGPVLQEIAEEKEGKLVVGKVNVDEEPELAQQFGVVSIPMLVYFKDGKMQSHSVGYMPKEEVIKTFGL
ncbi:MAG: thioredoxin [Treponema sp.]|nr:thioredoxin [Treponema sp.]